MFTKPHIYKTIVSSPAIAIECCIFETYLSLDNRLECYSFAIRNDFCINLYSAILIFSFDKSEYRLFLCTPSSFQFSCKSSLSFCSEITFIYFNLPSYLFFKTITSVNVDYFTKKKKIIIDCLSIIPQ